MQAYKIKVATSQESKEAQELLLWLGYKWLDGTEDIYIADDIDVIYSKSTGIIFYRSSDDALDDLTKETYQEITLPQLRDLVVLHRNDAGDATHVGEDGEMYYIANGVYSWQGEGWNQTSVLTPKLKLITKEQHQMTWQDALRAVADGKEVEFLSFVNGEWEDLATIHLGNIVYAKCDFRVVPQRKELNGKYTKEELLKIAGEMA